MMPVVIFLLIILFLFYWIWRSFEPKNDQINKVDKINKVQDIAKSNLTKKADNEKFIPNILLPPSCLPHPHLSIGLEKSRLTEYLSSEIKGGQFVASSNGTHTTSIVGAPFRQKN